MSFYKKYRENTSDIAKLIGFCYIILLFSIVKGAFAGGLNDKGSFICFNKDGISDTDNENATQTAMLTLGGVVSLCVVALFGTGSVICR
jgi:hypothetical protein